MLTFSIILNVILAIALTYVIFLHYGAIKDEDKDFIPDTLEDKFAQLKKDVVDIKDRLGEELSDVGDAVKEVGNQIDDIPGAFKSKRKGRKPNE